MSIVETIISNLDPKEQARARDRVAQAEAAGVAKCADCGILTGVFRVTLHNVVDRSGAKKQVCQGCRRNYR